MHSSVFGKLYHINTDTLIKKDFVWKKNIGFELFLKFSDFFNDIPSPPHVHWKFGGKNNCNDDKMMKSWYETDVYFFSN